MEDAELVEGPRDSAPGTLAVLTDGWNAGKVAGPIKYEGDTVKRSLGYFLAVLLVSTLAGAEEKSPKGRADQTSEAAAFPSIAMDQSRPGQYGSNLVDDPGEWDPASGSYTVNQCNCKRECPEVNKYQCKLTSDPFKACKMTNGMCGACTKDCGA